MRSQKWKAAAAWLAVLILAAQVARSDCKKRKSKSQREPTAKTPADFGRVQVATQDLAVQQAAKFAVREMQQMCEYCDEEVRDAYQAMTLKEIHSAETKDFEMLDGQMFILNATLLTTVPVHKRTEDTQTIVIFQEEDGSYMGISTERSPFLRH